MKLSILIPVYNEEKTLEEVFRRVNETQVESVDKEIIFVNDASKDKSAQILNHIQKKHPQVKVVHHSINTGKGGAIHSGLKAASGDIILIQDADLEYNPKNNYPNLLRPFFETDAEVVYGSRFVGGKYTRIHLFWHYMGNRALTFISNMFTNLNLTDMETGYKVFKKETLDKITLESKRFGFEVEVTAKIAKLKAIIYEVPITYQGRSYAEGKKITWKDGIAAFWHILKFNLSPLK